MFGNEVPLKEVNQEGALFDKAERPLGKGARGQCCLESMGFSAGRVGAGVCRMGLWSMVRVTEARGFWKRVAAL